MPAEVKASVEKGWVTLQGEVGWEYQKEAAMNCVRFLAGVKGIYNLITVRSTPQLATTRPGDETTLRCNGTAREAARAAPSCKFPC